jgi:transposase
VQSASFDNPDAEIAALRALLAERDAALAERDAILAERDGELRNASYEIEKLKVQLASLRRDRYGQSSEKRASEIGQLEMLIGDLEEDQAQAAAEAEARKAKGQSGKPRRLALRKPLPEHLPRETILHEPVFACRCGCTDPARLSRLGEDVTEVLEKIPARLKVIRHVRPRYACRACEAVLQTPVPDLPVEKGRPGPGLLAMCWCRSTSTACRSTASRPSWRARAWRSSARHWPTGSVVAPGGSAAWRRRSGSTPCATGVIWTDDTPIAVLAPGRGRTRQARFWVYTFDPRPWHGPSAPAAFYRYSPDRKGERPREHLQDFKGWLHADGYTGYDTLTRPRGNQPPQILHVACMAHARRKLFEVWEATKSPIAEEALQRMAALYAIEAETNGQPAPQRLTARQTRSKPLLDALHGWMQAQRRRLSGKSALGKAMQYALNRWDALARYLEDGRLSIDNNLSERLLRGIAVTRKNFLFVGSDAGGERAAIIYTVAETAKLNGLNPEAYIASVLNRLACGHPVTRINELLPWNFRLEMPSVAIG